MKRRTKDFVIAELHLMLVLLITVLIDRYKCMPLEYLLRHKGKTYGLSYCEYRDSIVRIR
jgi:hypothetical protein